MDRPDLPFGTGLVASVLAYGVGYLVTYLWQAPAVRDTLSPVNQFLQLVGSETIPVWKAVGWLFYNAHTVPIRLPALGQGHVTRSLIGNGGAPSLLYVVPPILLLVAGSWVAWWDGAEGFGRGGLVGASVAIGYVVLAIVGVFVFRYTVGGIVVGSDLVRAILLVGLVYPLVFGAIGGGVTAEIR
ncbi:MAG: transporter [Halodesulfurarchaeum sp.]